MTISLMSKIRRLSQRLVGPPVLEIQPTDCFLVSWPRSGNTWMRYMLFNALHPDHEWDVLTIDQRMPMLNRPDLSHLLKPMAGQGYRMFKSHGAFEERLLRGRVVYIVRDGRDALLSLYHYRQQMDGVSVPFSEFTRAALLGNVDYGSWQSHVDGWLAHGGHPSVLVMKYEEMLREPMQHLRRTLAHFGLEVTPERMEQAVARSTVDRVNRGFEKYAASRSKSFDGGLGGGSGKWRGTFSYADLVLFEQYAGAAMARAGYAVS